MPLAHFTMHDVEMVIASFTMAPIVAEFSGVPISGYAPLTVVFTDETDNDPTSWLWDFGDGETSTEQHPTHEYTLKGTYTVSLTATNAAGSDTEEKVDYITVLVRFHKTYNPEDGAADIAEHVDTEHHYSGAVRFSPVDDYLEIYEE